jgi:hypothetical protein
MSNALEKRIAELESRIDAIQSQLAKLAAPPPWWERIAGTFEKDGAYERAMQLGRQYRQSQRPTRKKPKRGT